MQYRKLNKYDLNWNQRPRLFRTDQFHAAGNSPSAAATQPWMLSPDSCDGALEEGEERPISIISII